MLTQEVIDISGMYTRTLEVDALTEADCLLLGLDAAVPQSHSSYRISL